MWNIYAAEPIASTQLSKKQGDKCSEILKNSKIAFDTSFAVGICIGMQTEEAAVFSQRDYRGYTDQIFALYDRVIDTFASKKMGFEVHQTASMIHMMGVFPMSEKGEFVQKHLIPLQKELEAYCGVKIQMGTGMPATGKQQLHNAYKTAQYAFEAHFFEAEPLIEFSNLHVEFHYTMENYDTYVEEAFHAILVKDTDVLAKIDRVIDLIGEIHYGNWQAVLMRTMNFTGEMGSKLRRYQLFSGDFFAMQNELQDQVLHACNFACVKEAVHAYYTNLLGMIYKTNRPNSKVIVTHIKHFIQENFMKELTIKELSEVACVSPNYFSHMFKNETGQNYKVYLTNVRLSHAMMLLLESDCKITEICERTGYKNVRTFVDAFKQKYGVSPSSYRKTMKQE